MLEAYREKFGTARTVLVWGGVYLVSQVVLGAIIHAMDPLLFLKAQTTFSRNVYLSIYNKWAVDGLISNYRLHFLFDCVHPFWYALFLSAWISKGLNVNAIHRRYNFLILIPFFAGLMDMIENGFHLGFVADINTATSGRIFFSALCANMKWGLAGISVLIGLALTTTYLFPGRRRSK